MVWNWSSMGIMCSFSFRTAFGLISFCLLPPKPKLSGSSAGQHQLAGFAVPEVCLTLCAEVSLPERCHSNVHAHRHFRQIERQDLTVFPGNMCKTKDGLSDGWAESCIPSQQSLQGSLCADSVSGLSAKTVNKGAN